MRLIWRNVLEKVAHHHELLLKKLQQVPLKVNIRSIKREKNCLMVIGQEVRKRKRKRNDRNQKRTIPEAKNLKFPKLWIPQMRLVLKDRSIKDWSLTVFQLLHFFCKLTVIELYWNCTYCVHIIRCEYIHSCPKNKYFVNLKICGRNDEWRFFHFAFSRNRALVEWTWITTGKRSLFRL